MKGFYLVMNLWLLQMGRSGAMTPGQSNDPGDTRASELTSTSLNLAVQRLNTVQQPPSQPSTRNTVDRLTLRTERALESTPPQHGQTTRPNEVDGISPTLGTEATGGRASPPNMGELNTTQTTTRNTKSGPLEGLTETTHSQTSSPKQSADILTGQTPPIAVQPQSNSSEEMHSTRVRFEVTQSPTTAVMTQAKSFSTEATSKPPLPNIPFQGPVTETTLTPLTPTGKHPSSPSEKPFIATSTTMFSSSAGVTKPTTPLSTQRTNSKPVENNSTTAGTVTAGDKVGGSTQSSGGTQRTPMATTKKSITSTTEAKKKPKPQLPKPDNRTKPGGHHGTVVAVLIGGALVLMMIGFLVIYVKKRNTQRQQMRSKDWAGPSPFLDGGVDNNGQVELRASNRISLASFLPQRLSKRLSLLQETDEELGDMTPSSTFGDHNPRSTFGREVAGEEVKASNGTAAVIQQETQTQEDPGPVRPPSPVMSAESDVPLSTDDPAPPPPVAPSEDVDIVQDCPGTDPPPPDVVEDIPPLQLDDDQGKTLDESSPPSLESADNPIPPAPPLAVSMQQHQQQ